MKFSFRGQFFSEEDNKYLNLEENQKYSSELFCYEFVKCVQKPKDVMKLIGAGISGKETQKYYETKIINIDNMIALKEQGVSGDDAESYFKAGIKDKYDMIALKKQGVDGGVAKTYLDVGFSNVFDIIALKKQGVDGGEAGDYSYAGISNVADIIKLRKRGARGSLAKYYYNLGLRYSTLIAVCQGQLSLSDVKLYTSAGIHTAFDIIKLKKEGVMGNDVKCYFNAGIKKIAEIIKLHKANITGFAAEAYFKAKIKKVAEMIALHEKNITGDEAEDFMDAQITNIDDMIKWKKEGISGFDAEGYFEAGIKEVANMIKLKKEGVRGNAAKSYFNAGIKEVANMIKLKKEGIWGPSAEYYFKAGIKEVAKMIASQKKGISGFDAESYFNAGIKDIDDMIKLKEEGLEPNSKSLNLIYTYVKNYKLKANEAKIIAELTKYTPPQLYWESVGGENNLKKLFAECKNKNENKIKETLSEIIKYLDDQEKGITTQINNEGNREEATWAVKIGFNKTIISNILKSETKTQTNNLRNLSIARFFFLPNLNEGIEKWEDKFDAEQKKFVLKEKASAGKIYQLLKSKNFIQSETKKPTWNISLNSIQKFYKALKAAKGAAKGAAEKLLRVWTQPEEEYNKVIKEQLKIFLENCPKQE